MRSVTGVTLARRKLISTVGRQKELRGTEVAELESPSFSSA